MEEGGFDFWDSSVPLPASPSLIITADRSWSTNGSLPLQAADWSMLGGPQCGGAGEESQDPLPLLGLDSPLNLDASSSGSAANRALSVDSQLQAGMDALLLEQTLVGAGGDTGPNHDVTMTLGDMIRIAEECGKDEAAGTVWSAEEHKALLHGLRRYAKLDRAHTCFYISTHLTNKTALDVALRCRWLQDKDRDAKQAQLLVHKDPAGVVKVSKEQGTKGAKKSKNMYPLSKEALDSKSTRELLRDSYTFMQQIEENIKSGELGEETADYFYLVRSNMDAIEKRGKEFCRMSMPLPPIDEEGLEEILQQSRHSSSAGKEAA